MAYSITDLGIKFNEKNKTNYETAWLLCGKCHYWLTSPIFMHQDEKYYCAKCSIHLGGGMRAKTAEILLQKSQYPCIHEECPAWFSFETIQKHKGVCKFNVFVCNFCSDQCTETEYLDHLMDNHFKVCDNIENTKPSLQIEFKSNSENKEKIIVGDYESYTIVIYAKIEKGQVYIGLASTQFDDTMKTKIGHQYELEDRCDGIFGKTRLGKFMSLQQLGNLKLSHCIILEKDWKGVEINITLENLGSLLKISDCPICMYAMKDSIVLCENGHPVCNSCAPKIKKCAVCRMTMNTVTLRLSDVIQHNKKPQKVDFKCFTVSKLEENKEVVQTVSMCKNSITNCPECNVEMTMNVLVAHFCQTHKHKLSQNDLIVARDSPYRYENNYIIGDGQLFRLRLFGNGSRAKICVSILTSNDSNVAKRYQYKFQGIPSNNPQQIPHTFAEGKCQIELEYNYTSVILTFLSDYTQYNCYIHKL